MLLKRALNTPARVLQHHRPQRRDAGRVLDDRDRRQHEQHGADHAASRAPARSWWPAPSTSTRCGAIARSWRSTAAPCRRRCSSRSCSATCAARSPARDTNKKGLIEVAEGGTHLPRRNRRDDADDAGEAAARAAGPPLPAAGRHRGSRRPTSASSRPPTRTCRSWWPRGGSAKTSSTGINVLPIQLPPLRERRRGHPAAGRALPARSSPRRWASRCGRSQRTALQLLQAHHWRGNVRELQNAIERAVALEQTRGGPAGEPARATCGVRHGGRADGDRRAAGAAGPRRGLRPRGARRGVLPALHRAGAGARRRGAGEGGGAARHELPVVPLLRQEIQSALDAADRRQRRVSDHFLTAAALTQSVRLPGLSAATGVRRHASMH